MTQIIPYFYQFAGSFALLTLASLGLMIIFGMMGIINMAHGEFMMIGALSAVFAHDYEMPLVVAIFVGAFTSAFLGLILERLIIRRFYNQLLISLIATWGLSLIITQLVLLIFGPSGKTLPSSFPPVHFWGYSFSSYRLMLIICSLSCLAAVIVFAKFTTLGVYARATMDNAEVSEALGINTSLIYSATFTAGSFFAGLAGALFAFEQPVSPTFGHSYTAIAFIVVVVAGSSNIFIGLPLALVLLAAIKTLLTINVTLLAGDVGMLLMALLIIRFAPTGIQELARNRRLRLIVQKLSGAKK